MINSEAEKRRVGVQGCGWGMRSVDQRDKAPGSRNPKLQRSNSTVGDYGHHGCSMVMKRTGMDLECSHRENNPWEKLVKGEEIDVLVTLPQCTLTWTPVPPKFLQICHRGSRKEEGKLLKNESVRTWESSSLRVCYDDVIIITRWLYDILSHRYFLNALLEKKSHWIVIKLSIAWSVRSVGKLLCLIGCFGSVALCFSLLPLPTHTLDTAVERLCICVLTLLLPNQS